MSLRGIMELVHINDLGEVGRNKMLNRVKKEDTSEEVDRLSDLSDHIIEHILCFLDTKYAVQTSVLSKRWRNLWTGVPVLDFNSDCFAQLVPFKKFVRNALRVREGDSIVGTFRFFYRGYDEHLMTRLINYVISHNVSHLDIWIGGEYNPFPPLPWKLLEYEALETLELKGFRFIQSFSFSKLTALFLDHCKFTFYDASDSDCFDLLSCCPNLIHLCLSSCLFNRLSVLKISGPQLLSLSLSDLSDDRDIGYCELEISAPGLTYFSCAKPDGIAFSIIDLPSLQHTDMDLPLLPMPLVNIFGGISNAQSLSLSPHTIEALDEALGLEFQFTPFSRLKSWNLTEDPDDGSFLIPTKVSTYLSSQLS